MSGRWAETDEERPYDSFGRNGMELESAGSEKPCRSLIPDATGRQSKPVHECGDGSGERGAAKGAEEASPDDLVELLMGAYGKADEFDAEHVAPHPADLAEFNRKGR